MSAGLREAAQALLDRLAKMTGEPFDPEETNLRSALAAPPEPGWGEGAEAMRAKIAARFLRGADSLKDPDRGYEMRLIAHEVASIPVPSAPTHAPPWKCEMAPDSGSLPASFLGVPLRRDEAAPTHAAPAPSKAWDGCLCDCRSPESGMPVTCPVHPPAPEAKTAESEG